MKSTVPQERADKLHLVLMLTLTFSTGVIDAVGFLGLDRVFTGNMTGNVVVLGMGFAGADDLPIVGPLIALGGFAAGAAAGGRVLRSVPVGWTRRTTAILLVVGLLVSSVAIPALIVTGRLPEPLALITTGILGFAMGMQAATARHIAVKDVTSVVITSTLIGLAFDSWCGRRVKQLWARRFVAIVLIAAGAAVGALAVSIHVGVGIGVAATITMTVALVGHFYTPETSSDVSVARAAS